MSIGAFRGLSDHGSMAGVYIASIVGIALTGAWVDKEKGLISVIALEMGGSADLLAYLQPGEPVILMGPTGTPTEIGYSQHEGVERAAWDDDKLQLVHGTHPVVHPAGGFHANLFE